MTLSDIVLRLEGVSKRFGGLSALDDIDMKLHRGEILGVVGHNGSGKTVLLNLISLIYAPTTGIISLPFAGSIGRRSKPEDTIKLRVARTFQESKIFTNMTVFENILAGMDCSSRGRPWSDRTNHRYQKERAEEMIQLFGGRLEPYLNESANALSFANQRRLEIVRALASDPKILLLDEPSAGMNPNETGELASELRQILKSNTISAIVVEHKVAFLKFLADRVMAMHQGKKIAEGPPGEILGEPHIAKAR